MLSTNDLIYIQDTGLLEGRSSPGPALGIVAWGEVALWSSRGHALLPGSPKAVREPTGDKSPGEEGEEPELGPSYVLGGNKTCAASKTAGRSRAQSCLAAQRGRP